MRVGDWIEGITMYSTYLIPKEQWKADYAKEQSWQANSRPWRCWYCGCYCYDGKKEVCQYCNGPRGPD